MKLLKKTSFAIAAFAAASAALAGTQKFPRSEAEDTDKLMSKEYWAIWNPEVQKKIDAEIEKNRKADAVVNLGEAAPTAPALSRNTGIPKNIGTTAKTQKTSRTGADPRRIR